jgi:hypothetical protein
VDGRHHLPGDQRARDGSDRRSEGATQAEAADATLTLDATDCAMMPEDPRSPYWPHLDDGTPVWMVLDAGAGAYDLIRGYISVMKPTWPGRSRHLCWVAVTVRGILDRLGRGTSPLLVPLARSIIGDGPVEHWPLDDGRDATQCASAVSGGTPMTITDTPRLADVDGPPGAPGRYLTIRNDDTIIGAVSATLTTPSVGYWEVEAWVNVTTDETHAFDTACLLSWTTTGTIAKWWMDARYRDTPGVVALTVWYQYSPTQRRGWDVDVPTPGWHFIRAQVRQLASTMEITVTVDDQVLTDDTEPSTSVGAITYLSTASVDPVFYQGLGGVPTASIAQVAVYTTPAGDHYQAGRGYTGEPAADRIARLCAEEGVPVAVTAGPSEPMGPQPAGALLALLRECEAADNGRLGEAGWGLSYRPRSTLYNQAVAFTLVGSQGEVADPFAPTKDLQRRRNEWKISRPNGSSAVYADKEDQKKGRLDDSATINVASDNVLIHHAQWRVGLGTTPGYRYPSLSTDLGRHPGLIAVWQALHLGDRVQAVNLVQQHPPGIVDQLVEGRRQTLRGRTGWSVTLITSPARPFTVFVLEDLDLGRLDADASTLAVGVDADDITLSVVTASGPLLTTTAAYPGDFPLAGELGGENVTVTAISGATSPQTVTVTRGVGGFTKQHPAGTALRLWQPGQLAL